MFILVTLLSLDCHETILFVGKLVKWRDYSVVTTNKILVIYLNIFGTQRMSEFLKRQFDGVRKKIIHKKRELSQMSKKLGCKIKVTEMWLREAGIMWWNEKKHREM